MPVVEASESEFELIPEGTIVHAKVLEISDVQEYDGPRGSFEKINWKFEVTQGEYKGFFILDGTSPKFSIDPPSKLYEWANALLGRTFDVGERLDTDDLLNLPCRIEVGYKPDRKDPDRMWMRVETMLPATGTGAGSAEDVFG